MRAEIVRINSAEPEHRLVSYVAQQIRSGKAVGMPTDTFYGLAVDPFNLRAVDTVYEIKSRSHHKPLSLLIESVDQAEELTRPMPSEFYALARRFWELDDRNSQRSSFSDGLRAVIVYFTSSRFCCRTRLQRG